MKEYLHMTNQEKFNEIIAQASALSPEKLDKLLDFVILLRTPLKTPERDQAAHRKGQKEEHSAI